MQVKRYDNIDIIKAFGIILMVCGHCNAPFTGWLYMFHMAVFFMASGYCWNSHNSKDFTNVKKYILKKFKTLYIPYVVINSVFVLLSNFFIKINVYTANPEFMNISGSGFVAARTFKDIIYYIVRVMVLWNSEPMGGATWFISALLIITVFHCITEYLLNKISSETLKNIIVIILVAAVVIMAEIMNRRTSFFMFEHITAPLFSGYIAYFIGIIIRKKENFFKIISTKWNVVLIIALVLFIKWLHNFGEISLGSGKYCNLPLFIAASVSGWILLKCVADIAVKNNRVKNVLVYIGRNTLSIVFLHFIAFKPISAVFVYAKGLEMEMTASFPTITGVPNYMWLIYTVSGIIIPLIMQYIYKTIISIIIERRI